VGSVDWFVMSVWCAVRSVWRVAGSVDFGVLGVWWSVGSA